MTAGDDPTAVLDASLTASVADDGDSVALAFTVRNADGEPAECSFRDGQRIDAVAECDPDGDDDGDSAGEAWRYGDGRMFPMALGTETIPAGGGVTFDATWPDPGPGVYRVRAWLTATDADASAEARVSVP